MRIPPSLISSLAALCLAGCSVPGQISPEFAREANAKIAEQEKGAASPSPSDYAETLLRLWANVPEYVQLLKNERFLKRGPRLLSSTAPKYPTLALLTGIRAKVVVSFIISPTGSVEAARILESSDSRFDQAALDSIMTWKFLPAESEDGPTRFAVTAPLEFAGWK